ncbi:T6SS phospholipase effector Tle1-like catalytic domain-containing protein, partial [Klebsiella pneumoniae]|uniref:phospholipase effector Tle1 domain-containing protein n=1 Tax=Klebsiella pneumoniae TaxID=573 RepID=UPI0013D3420A
YGLDDNVLDAYRFLATNYEEDDELFLFGFSRGAYTVRVLGGLLHLVGLLRPDQLNFAGYALAAYKRASEKSDFHIAWDFRRIA